MFCSWARAFNTLEVRSFFLVVGMIATFYLGPLSAFGVVLFFLLNASALMQGDFDQLVFYGWSMIGLGDFAGWVVAHDFACLLFWAPSFVWLEGCCFHLFLGAGWLAPSLYLLWSLRSLPAVWGCF